MPNQNCRIVRLFDNKFISGHFESFFQYYVGRRCVPMNATSQHPQRRHLIIKDCRDIQRRNDQCPLMGWTGCFLPRGSPVKTGTAKKQEKQSMEARTQNAALALTTIGADIGKDKGQKNDYNDAEVITEAALRPNLRTVSEKTQDQLDLQACHRVRSRLVSRRTATINQIRAFLIEQGITVRASESVVHFRIST
jgi:Transposase